MGSEAESSPSSAHTTAESSALRDLENIKVRDWRRIFGCSRSCNGRYGQKDQQGAYFNIFQSPKESSRNMLPILHRKIGELFLEGS
jgi:hypothetical protein